MQDKQGRFRVAALTFILGALVYILFMVLLRYDLRPSALVFWVSTLLMVGAIAYQILKYPNSEKFILLEIFLFTLLIHMESVLPYQAGIIGDDFPSYFYAIKAVMEHGIPIPGAIIASPPISELVTAGRISALAMYPVLILVGGSSAVITGVDFISISRWLPSIWSSLAIVVVFIFSKSIYNDNRVALLAALGLSTLATYITTHSQFNRESIAFVILLFLVYTLYAAYQKNRGNLRIAVILFAITIVLAHYFVSIIWIMLLAVLIVCFKSIDYLAEKRLIPSVSPSQTILGLAILSLTMAFGHWIYMETQVIPTVTSFFRATIRYGEPTFTDPTIYAAFKQQIISSGAYFFTASFAIIILWDIIKGFRGKCNYLKEDFTLGAWAAVIFIAHVILAANVILYPGRIPIFAYPFILLVVSHAALSIGRQRTKQILGVLIILFVFYNLFRLPIVPLNPFDSVERMKIGSTMEGNTVELGNWFPQGKQASKGGEFFQEADEEIGAAKFVRWFLVGNEKIWAEPIELVEGRSRFYEVRPYAKTYIEKSPDSYLQQNKIYNNGVVEIYK